MIRPCESWIYWIRANNSGDMVIDAGATMTADAMQDAAFTAGDAADQGKAIIHEDWFAKIGC
jgi:hypothetical protein